MAETRTSFTGFQHCKLLTILLQTHVEDVIFYREHGNYTTNHRIELLTENV